MKNKLKLNTREGLIKLQETLNTVINNKIESASLKEGINAVNKLSLGELKYIFENITDKLANTSKGMTCIGKYVKTIKENHNLADKYSLYENLKQANKFDNKIIYIKEAVNLGKKIKNDNLGDVQKIVTEAIKESKINSSDLEKLIKESKNSINGIFDNLLSESEKPNNLAKRLSEMVEISNQIPEEEKPIEEDEEVENVSTESLDGLTEGLESWEKEVINDLSLATMAGKTKLDLFEEYKTNCINALNESIADADIETKSNLENMKTKLMEKKYNEDNIINDLFILSELKHTI